MMNTVLCYQAMDNDLQPDELIGIDAESETHLEDIRVGIPKPAVSAEEKENAQVEIFTLKFVCEGIFSCEATWNPTPDLFNINFS